MKTIFRKNNIIIIIPTSLIWLGLFMFFCLSFPLATQASTEHNVRGYARLSGGVNDGTYIAFNCLDDAGGGKFPFNFPIKFAFGACMISDHGVHIDNNGNFSGSAWHYIEGEINFYTPTSTPVYTPDESFRNNCVKNPSSPGGNTPYCTAAAGCSACLVKDSGGDPGLVYGYARVANLATSTNPLYKNGWIKLDGISIESYNSLDAGDFRGTISAANTPSTIGSIRFNCDNGLGGNICASDPDNPNWKTYVWSLWVSEMSAPNLPYTNACSNGALKTSLKWRLESGKQRKWEIMVNTANNTSSPLYTTSGVGDISSFACTETNCHLNYNTSYYWWLRLWYSVDDIDPESSWIATPWIHYDHSSTGMGKIEAGRTDTIDDFSFITYKNEFPYFWYETSATPTPIIIGTSTEFTAYAQYYRPTAPNTALNCQAPYCTYDWSSSDWSASFNPNNTSTQNTTMGIFSQATSTSVTVKVTDPSGYFCYRTTGAGNANFGLPLWKEVKVKKDARQ